MLYVPADAATPISSDVEASSAFQTGRDVTRTSVGNSTPSAFELLFSQQIGSSLSANPSSQDDSKASNSLSGLHQKTNTSSPHPATAASNDLTVTDSFVNSLMYTHTALNGPTASVVPASAAKSSSDVKPSSGTNQTTAVIGNDASSLNHSKDVEASHIQTTNQSGKSPSDLVADESNPASAPATESQSGFVRSYAVVAQDLTNLLSNATAAVADQASASHATAETDDQLFIVNEFSIESTPQSSVVGGASNGSVAGQMQSNAGNGAINNANTAITIQRPTPKTDASSFVNSAIIPSSNRVGVPNIETESPISDQLATAVTRQLEEDSNPGSTTVRIQLDRADLGTVSLHLTIHNNVVSIRVIAQNQIAQQIINGQMSDLRQTLTENGVTCGQFQVAFNSSDQQFSDKRRSSQNAIALGLSPSSKWARPQFGSTSTSAPEGRLNFVA